MDLQQDYWYVSSLRAAVEGPKSQLDIIHRVRPPETVPVFPESIVRFDRQFVVHRREQEPSTDVRLFVLQGALCWWETRSQTTDSRDVARMFLWQQQTASPSSRRPDVRRRGQENLPPPLTPPPTTNRPPALQLNQSG